MGRLGGEKRVQKIVIWGEFKGISPWGDKERQGEGRVCKIMENWREVESFIDNPFDKYIQRPR